MEGEGFDQEDKCMVQFIVFWYQGVEVEMGEEQEELGVVNFFGKLEKDQNLMDLFQLQVEQVMVVMLVVEVVGVFLLK